MTPGPTRVLRAAVAAAVVLAPAVTAAAPAGALSTVPRSADAPAQTGLASWASCVSGAGGGDLLVLVDASQSLRQTDPDFKRVQAMEFLLRRLLAVTEDTAGSSSAAGADIRVSFAAFGTAYRKTTGWLALSDPQIEQRVTSFERENGELDTDYYAALDGARQALTARRGERQAAGDTPCEALVWLSDGEFSIQPRSGAPLRRYAPDADLTTAKGTSQAVRLGSAALCRAGGPVDALRRDGVKMLSIGLGTEQTNFRLFESMSTGSRCGALPPDGDFFRADALERLLLAIEQSFHKGPEGGDETDVCARPDAGCVGRQFVLDDSIKTFRAFTVVQQDRLEVDLVPPGQDPTSAGKGLLRFTYSSQDAPRTTTVGGYTVTEFWDSQRALSLRVSRAPGGATRWAGQWAVRAVDPKASRSAGKGFVELTIQGDKRPYLVGDKPLHVGESTTVQFGLRDLSGKPVDPAALPGELSLSADLTDSSGTTRTLLTDAGRDALLRPVPLDLTDIAVGNATLRMVLKATTAPTTDRNGNPVPGTQLDDEVVTRQVSLLTPAEYPQPITTQINFGTLPEGATTARGTVRVTGSGCVWITPAEVGIKPAGVSRAEVVGTGAVGQDSCQKVDGESDVPVELRLSEPGEGPVQGSLQLHAVPAGGGKDLPAPLTFRAEARSKIDPGVVLASLLVALVVGLGVPAVLWLVLVRLTSRMPRTSISAIAIPLDGGPPAGPKVDDLTGARRRTFELPLVPGMPVTLRARSSWWRPEGHVRPEAARAGSVVVLDQQGRPAGRDRTARLPLSLVGSWFAIGNGATAYAVGFLSGRPGAAERQRLEQQMQQGAAAALAALREDPDQDSAPDRPDPGWGRPSGPGGGTDAGWSRPGAGASGTAGDTGWERPPGPDAAPEGWSRPGGNEPAGR